MRIDETSTVYLSRLPCIYDDSIRAAGLNLQVARLLQPFTLSIPAIYSSILLSCITIAIKV